MSFYEYKIENRVYLKSSLLEQGGGVRHAFTTRLGGVSHGKIEGFNLGFRVDDDLGSVMENYRLLSLDIGTEPERMVLSKQTHTDNIRVADEADAGKGITRRSDIEDTDGLITVASKIALVVFSADCVPILMYDPRAGAVAAVHAGWRGSVKGIAEKAVRIMCGRFGSRAEDIRVAIGPSIGPCCFEFGQEAAEIFGGKYCTAGLNGKQMVDIWSYNRDRLTEVGVLADNIDISGICTACNCDKFYSYRRHKEGTGRLGAIIMLEG